MKILKYRWRTWLTPLLQEHSVLRNLVHGYLQDADVSYHGVQFHELAADLTMTNYPNANWHQDGCGHRLKAFIYTDDVVGSGDFPTRIAAGSQRMNWLPHHDAFSPWLMKAGLTANALAEERVESVLAQISDGGVEKDISKRELQVDDEKFREQYPISAAGINAMGMSESNRIISDMIASGIDHGNMDVNYGLKNMTTAQQENKSSKKRSYPIHHMTGKKFGGFIFDTQAMHACGKFYVPNVKYRGRKVYILDFAAMRHMEDLPKSQLDPGKRQALWKASNPFGRMQPHHAGSVANENFGHISPGACPTAFHPDRVRWNYCAKDVEDFVEKDVVVEEKK